MKIQKELYCIILVITRSYMYLKKYIVVLLRACVDVMGTKTKVKAFVYRESQLLGD